MTAPRLSRPASWRQAFVTAQGGRCHYCNRPGPSCEVGPDDRPWHLDHKTPLARGGQDDEGNLVLSCKRCNLAKGVQPYKQFRDFAAKAFWVPSDWRVSEFDLDQLMWLYAGAYPGHRGKDRDANDDVWRVDAERLVVETPSEDYGYRHIVLSYGDREDHNPRLAEQDNGKTVLTLVAEMRRLLPALVAEVRMLRAEAPDQAA